MLFYIKKCYPLIFVIFILFGIAHGMDAQYELPEFLQQIKHGLFEKRIGEIAYAMDSFIEKIPGWMRDDNHYEGFYHSLMHTLIRFTDNSIQSDSPTGSGRADSFIQIKSSNKENRSSYIFEFKIAKNKTESGQKSEHIKALKQIFDQDYYRQHQQDDIPMNLAAISFYAKGQPKAINGDQFKNLTCSALGLKVRDRSLIAHSFLLQEIEKRKEWILGKELARHSYWQSFINVNNWAKLHINEWSYEEASSFPLTGYKYNNIENYHTNLQKVRQALLNNDFSLFIKNMECILHAIPYSLRCNKDSYYQAIVYATMLCAGFKVDEIHHPESKSIMMSTPSRKIKIQCFFLDEKKRRTVADEIYKKMMEYIEKFQNTSVVALIIKKPSNKSNLKVFGEAVDFNIHGVMSVYENDGTKKMISLKDFKERLENSVKTDNGLGTPESLQNKRKSHSSYLENCHQPQAKKRLFS